MALTANAEIQCGGSYELDFCDFFMPPSVTIYKGAALTIESGRVRPLTAGAGKKFIGFALAEKTTTAGMTFEKITVCIRGITNLTVAGAALENIGGDCWATDDNTFTTSSAGHAVRIGKITDGKLGKWGVFYDAFCMN